MTETCHSLREIVRSASFILGDQEEGYEFTAFPEPRLMQFACEVLPLLADLFPDKFTEAKLVELSPGSRHDVGCDNVVGVTNFVADDGTEIVAAKADDPERLRALARFPDPCTNQCGSAKPPSKIFYIVDSNDKGSIETIPAIDPGAKLKARVLCRSESSLVANPDEPLPQKAWALIPAIRAWIVHSATLADDEELGRQIERAHYNDFVKMAQAAVAAEAAR